MPDVPDLEVRHRPVQVRGRVRFEAILREARALLAERGVDGFTIDDVAHRADIPVGSVYQFFPNKYAIVAELDARDTQALVEDLEAAASRFPTEDWQAETNHIIDIVAKHWAEDPSRRAVWLAMRSTAATRTAAAAHFQRLAMLLEPIVAELTPHLSAERRRTVAEVIVEVGQSMLHFSVSDGQPRPAMVAELKRMLRAYLRAVALDA
ncbi:MAG: TetR family transcriptional regulator [Candidatus Nanopelagicales bacterium]|jgi:AcrR family transcriptional regulator|nr:TetR family transcriptional regulator [Candidatus Nanopelagicales bacterium]